jgi:glycosyltransferase 2 family protein
LTVAAFIGAGASLPSAPGYIGIYQVACILALQLYGVLESQALAYSVVLQLLVFLVVGIQGGWAMVSCGLRLSELPSVPAHSG